MPSLPSAGSSHKGPRFRCFPPKNNVAASPPMLLVPCCQHPSHQASTPACDPQHPNNIVSASSSCPLPCSYGGSEHALHILLRLQLATKTSPKLGPYMKVCLMLLSMINFIYLPFLTTVPCQPRSHFLYLNPSSPPLLLLLYFSFFLLSLRLALCPPHLTAVITALHVRQQVWIWVVRRKFLSQFLLDTSSA